MKQFFVVAEIENIEARLVPSVGLRSLLIGCNKARTTVSLRCSPPSQHENTPKDSFHLRQMG